MDIQTRMTRIAPIQVGITAQQKLWLDPIIKADNRIFSVYQEFSALIALSKSPQYVGKNILLAARTISMKLHNIITEQQENFLRTFYLHKEKEGDPEYSLRSHIKDLELPLNYIKALLRDIEFIRLLLNSIEEKHKTLVSMSEGFIDSDLLTQACATHNKQGILPAILPSFALKEQEMTTFEISSFEKEAISSEQKKSSAQTNSEHLEELLYKVFCCWRSLRDQYIDIFSKNNRKCQVDGKIPEVFIGLGEELIQNFSDSTKNKVMLGVVAEDKKYLTTLKKCMEDCIQDFQVNPYIGLVKTLGSLGVLQRAHFYVANSQKSHGLISVFDKLIKDLNVMIDPAYNSIFTILPRLFTESLEGIRGYHDLLQKVYRLEDEAISKLFFQFSWKSYRVGFQKSKDSHCGFYEDISQRVYKMETYFYQMVQQFTLHDEPFEIWNTTKRYALRRIIIKSFNHPNSFYYTRDIGPGFENRRKFFHKLICACCNLIYFTSCARAFFHNDPTRTIQRRQYYYSEFFKQLDSIIKAHSKTMVENSLPALPVRNDAPGELSGVLTAYQDRLYGLLPKQTEQTGEEFSSTLSNKP